MIRYYISCGICFAFLLSLNVQPGTPRYWELLDFAFIPISSPCKEKTGFLGTKKHSVNLWSNYGTLFAFISVTAAKQNWLTIGRKVSDYKKHF